MKKYMFRISLLCFVMLFFSCKGLFDLIDAIDATDIAADRSYRGKVFIQIPNELKADKYKLTFVYLDTTVEHDQTWLMKDLDDSQKAGEKNQYNNISFSAFIDNSDCLIKKLNMLISV